MTTLNKTKNKLFRAISIALIFLHTAVFAAPPASNELPTGGQVTAGQASITQTNASMNINQSTDKAVINWQTFNIGSQAQVNFNQPSASSATLNRVLTPDASQIFGRLTANGQVFILNPNGIIFGQGSSVNVGGIVASTMKISDADFMNGVYRFERDGSTGSILNYGNITAADGGYIALLAPEVRNEGILSAKLGTVAIGAGDKATLDFNGDSLIGITVEPAAIDTFIENKHLIQADGGRVIMSASAANSLLSSIVSNEGVIQAQTIGEKDGVIKLLAGMESGGVVKVGGTLDASAPNGGDSGFIETSGHNVELNNPTVTAAAPYGKGGTWLIDPTDVLMDAAYNAPIVASLNAGTSVTVVLPQQQGRNSATSP
ncbi:MAG: filamentous hemagglutinin N-terminal domain-containing protein [Nitrospirae bacterium]|nr:filamentous hemagglutinin N-terminal domain-containing protein [Nitrospirota bacterium]